MGEKKDRSWLCGLAWGGLSILPNSRIRPCCRYWGSWAANESLDGNLANHPEALKMRERMLAGEAPIGCRRCVADEKAGIRSKRLRSEHLFERMEKPLRPESELSSLTHLEYNLGNLCNLKCLTCNPRDSSAWSRDARVAGYEEVPMDRPDLEMLRPHLPYIKRIDLLGGETFLAKELNRTLELLVSEGKPEEVFLAVTTNVTIFPSEKTRRLIEKFKSVEITCSIDAYGERNEFIRHPSNWKSLRENMDLFFRWTATRSNLRLRMMSTISAYSYPDLPRLLRWWEEFVKGHSGESAAELFWVNTLLTPDFQAVHVLPRTVRERTARALEVFGGDFLEKTRMVSDFALSTDAPERLEKLRKWTLRLDQVRGTKSKDLVPEIYEE